MTFGVPVAIFVVWKFALGAACRVGYFVNFVADCTVE